MADTTKDIWNDNDGEESPKKSRKFRGIGVFLLTLVVVLGVVLFARGMGLALGVFGAWLALLQPGMTCQGGKHDVKYSYYHM